MKLIICGSRDIVPDYATVTELIDAATNGVVPKLIISGGCRGVDAVGEEWAHDHDVPLRVYQAQWDAHGKKAGPLRNAAMVAEADAVVAICYPDSRGTMDCVRRAQAKGIPVAMLVLPRAGR